MSLNRDKGLRAQLGSWTLELVVAMGILTTIMIPIGFSFAHEMKLMRAYYYRAVLMELIDGELEVLRAGEWKSFKRGFQTYALDTNKARLLPPGSFTLTLEESRLRLAWTPAKKAHGGAVWREADFPTRQGDQKSGGGKFDNPVPSEAPPQTCKIYRKENASVPFLFPLLAPRL